LGTEEVIELGQHSLFGQNGVHLGLEPRSQRHQLGPVAHELPQLPQLWWGDPRLGQVVTAEAMGDLGGVPLVVLHPPSGPVQTRRVHQVHRGATGLEEVHRPVPAVGCLQGHLRVGARFRQGHPQCHRIVVHPHGGQLLAVFVHAHDHRPPPVQVDAHVLSFHDRSSLSRGAIGLATPSGSPLGGARDGEDLLACLRTGAGHGAPPMRSPLPREGAAAAPSHRITSARLVQERFNGAFPAWSSGGVASIRWCKSRRA
jgi:hypothetical protein